jgi:hypothetical protein
MFNRVPYSQERNYAPPDLQGDNHEFRPTLLQTFHLPRLNPDTEVTSFETNILSIQVDGTLLTRASLPFLVAHNACFLCPFLPLVLPLLIPLLTPEIFSFNVPTGQRQ